MPCWDLASKQGLFLDQRFAASNIFPRGMVTGTAKCMLVRDALKENDVEKGRKNRTVGARNVQLCRCQPFFVVGWSNLRKRPESWHLPLVFDVAKLGCGRTRGKNYEKFHPLVAVFHLSDALGDCSDVFLFLFGKGYFYSWVSKWGNFWNCLFNRNIFSFLKLNFGRANYVISIFLNHVLLSEKKKHKMAGGFFEGKPYGCFRK